MKFLQSYYTDIGNKRETNQDSVALLKAETEYGDVLLTIVCDGMGGYSLGELASKYCVSSFCKWFKRDFHSLLYMSDSLNEALQSEWISLVRRMNSTLANYCEREKLKMGCTLTAFLFLEHSYYAIHVGDSRGYMITDSVSQITQDQSVCAEDNKDSELSHGKGRKRNVLTQSIGITRTVKPIFYSGSTEPDNCFLLCTDGFWHHTTDMEMRRYLSGASIKDNQQLRMHLNYLVEQAKEKGEKDNISCLAVIPKEE